VQDGLGVFDVPLKSGWFLLISATIDLCSKSKILREVSVPAHNQYRVGLKIKVLMVSPASKVYKALFSLRSHNRIVPSRPPEAHKEPSGEIVTVET